MSIAPETDVVDVNPQGAEAVDQADASTVIEEVQEAPDVPLEHLIRVLRRNSCPSLTGRSTLGYELGLKDESELYLRLVSNTGSGFYSKHWVACSMLEPVINGASQLTSTAFKSLFPNQSVNTGGFVMAVVKALGLIQTNVTNTRWHEQVPETSFEQIVIEAMVQQDQDVETVSPTKASGKRKGKEA